MHYIGIHLNLINIFKNMGMIISGYWSFRGRRFVPVTEEQNEVKCLVMSYIKLCGGHRAHGHMSIYFYIICVSVCIYIQVVIFSSA